MRTIDYKTIQSLVTVGDLFEPVKQSFIDYTSPRLIGIPVSLLHFGNKADAHIKIAALKDYPYFSIKVATMFPDNIKQNLPPNDGAIFLFDGKTGEPKVILKDKGLLTDLRTAAAGAVITNYVASKKSSSVAIIGTGLQAYHQSVALAKLRDISTLIIYGRNAEKAILLKSKLDKELPNISIKIAGSAEEAVKNAEVIITTTASHLPLVKGDWLRKGQHITALGADDSFKNELDQLAFNYADYVFVDSLELNLKFGEYAAALKTYPNLSEKTIEFGEAFQNADFSNMENKITIAKLVGLGVQDLAAATVVMDKLISCN